MTAIKQIAKKALQRCPAIWYPLQSVRAFRQRKAKYAVFQADFQEAVYGEKPIRVLCGPFAGMEYFNQIVWGPVTPKWIGSFESELHGVISEIESTPYDVVVDIGAAEGYYAIGLARSLPNSCVITYDVDFIGRRRQRDLAARNAVSERIQIRGRCDHSNLQADLASGRCLVICDVEGAELELIDPGKVPNLRRADLLVECHRMERYSVDDVSAALIARVESSHAVAEIHSQPRCADDWSSKHPALVGVSKEQLAFAIDEFRYPQKWLWMKAR
jgi:hypothetical protein